MPSLLWFSPTRSPRPLCLEVRLQKEQKYQQHTKVGIRDFFERACLIQVHGTRWASCKGTGRAGVGDKCFNHLVN